MTLDWYHAALVAVSVALAYRYWRTTRRLARVREALRLHKAMACDVDGASADLAHPTPDPERQLSLALLLVLIAYAGFIGAVSSVQTARETACAACGGRIAQATCVVPSAASARTSRP